VVGGEKPPPPPPHTTYYLPHTARGHGLFGGVEVAGRMAAAGDAPTFDPWLFCDSFQGRKVICFIRKLIWESQRVQ
jgi:hypothetical protein